jgi:peptidoglycan/LPS O-acetylase OafA/YrhL
MGFLRFFLAVSVIFTHVGSYKGFHLGNGRLAEQAFYMISGFYMAMVWTGKYSTCLNPIRTFYFSRALRIYPLYFIMLGLTLLWSLFAQLPPLEYAAAHTVDLFTKTWVYLTQITLIGMENAILYHMEGYWLSPVAWSLGLELTFYLLVPFLVPHKRLTIAIFIVSLVARYVACLHFGWQVGNNRYSYFWAYRFFPFEIAIFIFGMFSYQIFSKLLTRWIKVFIKPEIHFFVSFFNWPALFFSSIISLFRRKCFLDLLCNDFSVYLGSFSK